MYNATHTTLSDSELVEETLIDAIVYGADDEKIGTVSHVHGLGAATEVIIDVGGFLGIGSKPVALTINQLEFIRDDTGAVYASTAWTKDHMMNLPEHHH